jgi:hypothetical protein
MTTTPDLTPDAEAVRLAKVAALQQRRASSAPAAGTTTSRSKRRKSVAQGSKIAATAIGLTTMFGLVAAMGAAANNSSAAATAVAPAPIAPANVVVVIHPAGAAGSTAAVTPAAGVQLATTQPIALSAQPIVRQAPASPAPAATTRGSK